MSGNLFEGSDRIGTGLYMFLFFAFKIILGKMGIEIRFLRFLNNKKTHGDMDIIWCPTNPEAPVITPEILRKIFKPLEIRGSSILISFLKRKIACDFLICHGDIEMHHFYASYGLTMCIIGKFLFSLGLHLGPDGLYVVKRIGGKDFIYYLSKSPREICEILNLSYDKWLEGFKDEDDIVIWLLNCMVMGFSIKSSNVFKIKNLMTKPSDMKKLENPLFKLFVEIHKKINKYVISPCMTDIFLEKFGLMPKFHEDVASFEQSEMNKLTYKTKFNIDKIKKRLGIGKKDVRMGVFIADLYKKVKVESTGTFEKWVIDTEQEEIDATIDEVCVAFQGTKK